MENSWYFDVSEAVSTVTAAILNPKPMMHKVFSLKLVTILELLPENIFKIEKKNVNLDS